MPAILQLDSIALPHALIWTDRDAWQPLVQESERLLGGREVTEYAGLVAGRPITLAGERNQGWIDRATADALQALAQLPGATFSLQIHTAVFTVMFRHEDPPAFNFEPFVKRLNPDPTDKGIPTIKLKTV